MITVANQRLGETVINPASGTGGFLVEAFNHLSQQVQTVANAQGSSAMNRRVILGHPWRDSLLSTRKKSRPGWPERLLLLPGPRFGGAVLRSDASGRFLFFLRRGGGADGDAEAPVFERLFIAAVHREQEVANLERFKQGRALGLRILTFGKAEQLLALPDFLLDAGLQFLNVGLESGCVVGPLRVGGRGCSRANTIRNWVFSKGIEVNFQHA